MRTLGFEPRVAFMSYSTFGNPMGERSDKVREAVALLDEHGRASTSNTKARCRRSWRWSRKPRDNYPFMRLTGPANVLIMPAIHSASISTKLLQSLGGATVVGPILLGLAKPVQICPLSASVSKILMMAQMARLRATDGRARG